MSDSVDRVFIHALQTVRKLPRTGSSRPPPHDRLRLYGLYKQSMEGDVESILPRPIPIEQTSPNQRSQSLDQALSRSPGSPSPPSPPTAAAQRGEIEKWDAWHSCAGMSRTDAKRKYIDYLIETMKKYACSTQEGRELVSELEFVWDQVKSNAASSRGGSGSSEDSTNGRPRPSRPRLMGTTDSSNMIFSFNSGSNQDRGSRQGRSRSGIPAGQFERGGASSRPLRVLSPVSRNDNGDISATEDDDNLDDSDDDAEVGDHGSDQRPPSKRASSGGRTPASQRKWKQRIESALSRLSVEVAALREQMSDSRIVPRNSQRRTTRWLWAWFKWVLWTALRQLLLDLFLLGCVILWGRWKGDRRIEEAMRRWLIRWRDRIKALHRSRGWFIYGVLGRIMR